MRSTNKGIPVANEGRKLCGKKMSRHYYGNMLKLNTSIEAMFLTLKLKVSLFENSTPDNTSGMSSHTNSAIMR